MTAVARRAGQAPFLLALALWVLAPPVLANALPADPAVPAAAGRPGTAARPLMDPPRNPVGAPGLVPRYGQLGTLCEIAVTAEPAAGATVLLTVDAPCDGQDRVTISHGGLAASYLLSPSGQLQARFPALSDEAVYDVALADGRTAAAQAQVPGAEGWERVATLWRGTDALSVHAFEFGADYGRRGHVWHGAPSAETAAEAGRGGFLMQLGDPDLPSGRRAEVYSFPAAAAARPGSVRVALEAAVTPGTCGRDLRAQTLQTGAGRPGQPVEIVLAMPPCDAEGGYLVLNNIAQPLIIAAK